MEEWVKKLKQFLAPYERVTGINHQIYTRITRVTFTTAQGNTGLKKLLGPNHDRIGFIVYNDSSSVILIALDNKPAVEKRFTTKVGANTEWPYLPESKPYTQQVTYNPESAADGALQVTEFVIQKTRSR